MNILEHHHKKPLPYKSSYFTFSRPVEKIFHLGDPFPQLPVTRYFIVDGTIDKTGFVETKLYIEHWINNGMDGHFEMIYMGYFIFDITAEYTEGFFTPKHGDVYNELMDWY